MNRTPHVPVVAMALAATLALCTALPAHADPLRFEIGGVFTPQTRLTPFSAPGSSWSMSFVVDRQPAANVAYSEIGGYTNVPFGDFRLVVDGQAKDAAATLFLFPDSQGGGMDVVFGNFSFGDYYDALGMYGAAFYSGSELAPTLVPGTYPIGDGGLYVSFGGINDDQPATVLTISAVPMPPSAALMLCGLAMLSVMRRRRGAGTPALT